MSSCSTPGHVWAGLATVVSPVSVSLAWHSTDTDEVAGTVCRVHYQLAFMCPFSNPRGCVSQWDHPLPFR